MGQTGWETFLSRFMIQQERERCTQIKEVEKEREAKKQLSIEVTGSIVSHWSIDI